MADPDAVPMTDEEWAAAPRVAQVKTIRRALKLSQEEFAASFHIPIGTLRDWEQGRKEPDAAARAYLRVIAREPDVVRRALNPVSLKARLVSKSLKVYPWLSAFGGGYNRTFTVFSASYLPQRLLIDDHPGVWSGLGGRVMRRFYDIVSLALSSCYTLEFLEIRISCARTCAYDSCSSEHDESSTRGAERSVS